MSQDKVNDLVTPDLADFPDELQSAISAHTQRKVIEELENLRVPDMYGTIDSPCVLCGFDWEKAGDYIEHRINELKAGGQ